MIWTFYFNSYQTLEIDEVKYLAMIFQVNVFGPPRLHLLQESIFSGLSCFILFELCWQSVSSDTEKMQLFGCVCASVPSTRQRPSYGDCLEVKREYCQNCSVLDCVTQCLQFAAHSYEQFYRSNRLGLSHWDPYAVLKGGCLELYYCNMVEWFWWDPSLISTTNWFPSMSLVSFNALTLLVWLSGL